MKRMLPILIMAMVTAAGCTIYVRSGRSFNHHAKKQLTVSSPLEAGGKVKATLTHMNFIVTGQEQNSCTVVTDLSVSAVSKEIADAVAELIDIELVQEADGLAVRLQKPVEYEEEDYTVSGKMTITVPSETSLSLTTTHGDCTIDNIVGKINILSTHGDLTFNNIRGDTAAVSTHGSIELMNSKSQTVGIKTTHGRIELNDCDTENVACSTTHAPIRLKTVSADSLTLQSTHGPIELSSSRAKEAELNTTHGAIRGDITMIERINAQTTHAPIRLNCMNDDHPNFIATLNTTHNNIEFQPPAGFSGTVRASTSHGKIHSDIPMMVQGSIGEDNVTGTIGEGTGSITITSTHGNITLKETK